MVVEYSFTFLCFQCLLSFINWKDSRLFNGFKQLFICLFYNCVMLVWLVRILYHTHPINTCNKFVSQLSISLFYLSTFDIPVLESGFLQKRFSVEIFQWSLLTIYTVAAVPRLECKFLSYPFKEQPFAKRRGAS